MLSIGILGTIVGERITESDDGQGSVLSDLSFVHSYIHSFILPFLQWTCKPQETWNSDKWGSIRSGKDISEDIDKRVTNFCQRKNVILDCNIAQGTS